MSKNKVWTLVLLGLIGLSLLVIVISLSSGSVGISSKKIFLLILHKLKGQSLPTTEAAIIFSIRIPRVILGFMVGGALSLAGVMLQAMFRNPLVEPYTMGISGGAGLAVSVFVVFGFSANLGLPLAGFIGAVLAIFLVYIIGKRYGAINIMGLLLTGVMFSFICSSLIMLIMSLAKADEAHSILFWIMGNLGENDPSLVRFVSLVIPFGALLSFLKAWDLNALSLGDEEAFHLGVDVTRTKRQLFILASFMTGIAVSVSGIIGFVGLVVPHFMRMVVGTDHRILMPASFLLGGIFLTLCDTVARTALAPVELPVGVITGLIGGIIFLYFVTRNTKKI